MKETRSSEGRDSWSGNPQIQRANGLSLHQQDNRLVVCTHQDLMLPINKHFLEAKLRKMSCHFLHASWHGTVGQVTKYSRSCEKTRHWGWSGLTGFPEERTAWLAYRFKWTGLKYVFKTKKTKQNKTTNQCKHQKQTNKPTFLLAPLSRKMYWIYYISCTTLELCWTSQHQC